MVNSATVKSAFLQANDEAFRELVTFVDFAAEKLTICFVSVNFAEDSAAIIGALRQHSACQDIQFVQFEFNDPKLQFLQDELIQNLSKTKQEPDKKKVLLLTGLEASIKMVGELGDYPPVLVDLNYVRDGFTTNVPYPVVIFLPDRALSRLAEFAPDFWAWRRAVVRFKSVSSAVKLKVDRYVRRSSSLEFLSDSERFYAFHDYRDTRQDDISRLLMEFESGILSENSDYASFKPNLVAELALLSYGQGFFNNEKIDLAEGYFKQLLEPGELKQSKYPDRMIRVCLGCIDNTPDSFRNVAISFSAYEV